MVSSKNVYRRRRSSESSLCGTRLCCAPQGWSAGGWNGPLLDKAISTLCSPASGNECDTGHGDDVALLHSPLVLNCFRVLSKSVRLSRHTARGPDEPRWETDTRVRKDRQDDVSHKDGSSQTGRVCLERQTGELLEGSTGSSLRYINTSRSGINLHPAS